MNISRLPEDNVKLLLSVTTCILGIDKLTSTVTFVILLSHERLTDIEMLSKGGHVWCGSRRLNCFFSQKTNLFCSSYSLVVASRFKTTFHDSCQIFVPEWVDYLISHTTCGPCFSDAEVCQREYKMGASSLSHRRASWFSKRSCECLWSFNLFILLWFGQRIFDT